MMTEKAIVNKYLGIPYKHQGRELTGLDCWGLAIMIYKDLGFELLDINETYDEDWGWKGKNYFIENYHKEWKETKTPELFDGVLFKNAKGVCNHGGIVLRDGRFIHCVKKHGVIVSRLSDPAWQKRTAGYYHLKARA